MLARSGCPVREVIAYIVAKFEKNGMSNMRGRPIGARSKQNIDIAPQSVGRDRFTGRPC